MGIGGIEDITRKFSKCLQVSVASERESPFVWTNKLFYQNEYQTSNCQLIFYSRNEYQTSNCQLIFYPRNDNVFAYDCDL